MPTPASARKCRSRPPLSSPGGQPQTKPMALSVFSANLLLSLPCRLPFVGPPVAQPISVRHRKSLASSAAAREAGLDPVQVLSALSPARRSMVGSLNSSPTEAMAGLLVALAEVRGVPCAIWVVIAEQEVFRFLVACDGRLKLLHFFVNTRCGVEGLSRPSPTKKGHQQV